MHTYIQHRHNIKIKIKGSQASLLNMLGVPTHVHTYVDVHVIITPQMCNCSNQTIAWKSWFRMKGNQRLGSVVNKIKSLRL